MIPRKEVVMAILASTSVIIILFEYFAAPTIDQLIMLMLIDIVIVAVLSVDLVSRARTSGSIRRYIVRNWYELIALTPLAVFYLLETQTIIGALFRGLRLLRILRLTIAIARTAKTLSYTVTIIEKSRLLYLLVVSAVIVFIGGISSYVLEADIPDSRIKNLSDAFWWALATVTTVGYGDIVPVTFTGRIIGAILMIVGITIFGIFISTLGATLVEKRIKREVSTINEEIKQAIKKKIDTIEHLSEKELQELINTIKALHMTGEQEQH